MPDYNVWHVCEYGAVLEYDDSSGLIIVHPNLGNQGDLKKDDESALSTHNIHYLCDRTLHVREPPVNVDSFLSPLQKSTL